jgi:hypothetical protein
MLLKNKGTKTKKIKNIIFFDDAIGIKIFSVTIIRPVEHVIKIQGS